MRILQFSTFDRAGGAERAALNLHQSYLALGHRSILIVRHKRTDTPDVLEYFPYENVSRPGRFIQSIDQAINQLPYFRGRYRICDWLRRLAVPQRAWNHVRGVQNKPYAYISRLINGWNPDVIQAHNLHGDYFDLRALPQFSPRIPFVWTLHDNWPFTGHCGCYIDCKRWQSGCGSCPDLNRPPAVLRDMTRENWRFKKDIYQRSRIAVSTPSRWQIENVKRSMLKPEECRLMPYGVDTSTFHSGDRQSARQRLGIPADTFVCLFAAVSGSSFNPYKDFLTVKQAIDVAVRATHPSEMLFICLGNSNGDEAGRVLYPGYITDPAVMADYFRAADVLLHAARADNSPFVILESLACGTPVIATDVGGISEQIVDGKTGYLVPRGRSDLMADRLLELLKNPDQLENTKTLIRQSYEPLSIRASAINYIEWFGQLIIKRQ